MWRLPFLFSVTFFYMQDQLFLTILLPSRYSYITRFFLSSSNFFIIFFLRKEESKLYMLSPRLFLSLSFPLLPVYRNADGLSECHCTLLVYQFPFHLGYQKLENLSYYLEINKTNNKLIIFLSESLLQIVLNGSGIIRCKNTQKERGTN